MERIVGAVTPATRVVALTWVHSSTGLKLPLRRIADALEEINGVREDGARVLLCVDGVHGFGIEDVTLSDLGCDFLVAGCHKWVFGPRGTGVVAGTPRGWAAVLPTIPSFIDSDSWKAWATGTELEGPSTAARMTPGGYKAFEHLWAISSAAQKRSVCRDCLVVHAGTCEAVSTLAFPANRQFIRQLRKNRPIAAKAGGQFSPMCRDLDAIPRKHEQGTFVGDQ